MIRLPLLTSLNPRLAIPTALIFLILTYTLLDTYFFETPTLPPISSYLPTSFSGSGYRSSAAFHYTSSTHNGLIQTSEERQNNHHLTHSQCLQTYPRLYEEADRAAKYYERKGGITLKDVDEAERENAAARIVILDNQLYVRAYYGGINSRAQAALAALYRTVTSSPEGVADVDMVLQVNDAGDGNLPVFALCRKESQPGLWLMPDFGFYAWPEPMGSGAGSYTEIRKAALEREKEIAGNVSTSASSSALGGTSDEEFGVGFGKDDVAQGDGRSGKLEGEGSESESDFSEMEIDSRSGDLFGRRVKHSHTGASTASGSAASGTEASKAMQEGKIEEAEEDKEEEVEVGGLAEVEEEEQPQSWLGKVEKLFWRGVPMVDIRQQLFRASENQLWSEVADVNWGKLDEGKYTSMADHCDYKYLAHVEGWAYSGRLKYIQMCRSVIVTHPLQYIQHYHHLFNTDPKSPLQNMVEVQTPLEKHLPNAMAKLLEDQERSELIASNSWREFREGYISPAANECYFRYAIAAYASVQRFQPELNGAVSYESFVLTGRTSWEPHR